LLDGLNTQLTRFAWWRQDLHAIELLRAHIGEWTITRMLDYWWVMCFTGYRCIELEFMDLDTFSRWFGMHPSLCTSWYSSIASGNNCIVQLCKCVSLHL
jgi:hypothetical protein